MRSLPARPVSAPPLHYIQFIEDCKAFVAERGVCWDIPLLADGTAPRTVAWDLRKLTGSYRRNATWLRTFAMDARTRAAALNAGWPEADLPGGTVVAEPAQEFIKAMAAHRCNGGFSEGATKDLVRALICLFSVSEKMPWELSSHDIARYFELGGPEPVSALYLRPLIPTINKHLLSINAPLRVETVTGAVRQMLESLEQRKEAHKLPEMRSLYELARIVFCEEPQSHQDLIRFAILRVAILTGLRIEEVLMLPHACLRWETNIDVVTGKPAGEVGGATNSLALHYFGEKRDQQTPDLLIEDVQWVPQRFHIALQEAIDMASKATASLRQVLKAQHLQPELYPKSDLRRFRTSEGKELDSTDLLFLVLYRGRGHLPEPMDPSAKIALAHYASLAQALGISSRRGSTVTMFMKYSGEPDAKEMSVAPHSLRHLLNTELFRLGVPDTIITQQFGRESVAQSYEYDHRSLGENLKFVSLPEEAMRTFRPGSTQELVAKMVVSGTVNESHLARSFKQIQVRDGDRAAFTYLAANSDGFHVTPYGFCTNSFSLDPCARHLKCFDACKHFAASGKPSHRIALHDLLGSLEKMRAVAASKPAKSIGRKNQIAHADKLLAGVRAALDAQPGVTLFPDGSDHSRPAPDLLT